MKKFFKAETVKRDLLVGYGLQKSVTPVVVAGKVKIKRQWIATWQGEPIGEFTHQRPAIDFIKEKARS